MFGDIEPRTIQAVGALNKHDVDEYGTVSMEFGEKGVSTFSYCISKEYENNAFIFGTGGVIKVSRFCPHELLLF